MILTVSMIADPVVVGAIIKGFFIVAPVGWLLLQGGTIGSASSGATVLASPLAKALFTSLWNNLADAQAPVSGGRGASATADFAANKTITIPDMRQRFPLGKSASGTGSTLGGTGGSIDHLHTVDPPSTTTSGPSGTSGQLVGVINVASATHTHTVDIPSFNSGTNNPPFVSVNYIIKY